MHAQNIDIDDMQCWVFRMAQNRWKKSPEECAKIFQENNVFEFISDCYDYLHLSSYECALDEVETMLKNRGVSLSELNDQQREVCAVTVMRTMLEDYSEDTGIPFRKLFFQFAVSPAYDMLFDYSTGLWKEGPDYLRDTFEDALHYSPKNRPSS